MRKKKIKILHVAQAAGGVDRYIRMLLKYLDACKRWRGHRRGKTETDTASEPENPEREDAPRSCVAHGTVLSGRD